MRALTDAMAELEAKATAAKSLYDRGAEATAEDLESVRKLNAEIATLETEINGIREFEATRAANDARLASMAKPEPVAIGNSIPATTAPVEYANPATARVRTENFRDPATAYRFAQWFGAALGNRRAQQWCRDHGLMQFAMSGEVDSAGGIMVPIEFQPDLIANLENYGAARKLCRVWPMSSDTLVVPRLTTGLTVYAPGQGGSITASDVTTDGVQLKVDTFATLTYLSNELVADAAVGAADVIFGEIARAFASNEDNMLANGDGTVTYFNRVGLIQAFKNVSSAGDLTTNNTYFGGLHVGAATSNASWSVITLADMAAVVGRVPAYADNANTKWMCSKAFFGAVMQRLAWAAGGATAAETQSTVAPRFLGYPVVFNQHMARVPAASVPLAYLGDFTKASALGDKGEYTIAQSSDVAFATNQLAIRGTSRTDIVVHDVGNYSATPASRVAGPVVMLLAAAQ